MTPYETPTETYHQQLNEKTALTLQEFSEFGVGDIAVHPSPPSAYRMRAEFKVWHENDQAHFAMFEPGRHKKPYKIPYFLPGSPYMQKLMQPLLKRINQSQVLKSKLFQAEFLTTTTDEAVISLIYHKPLNELWQQEAIKLAEQLGANIIGRSRKQKLVIGTDFVTEVFRVNDREFFYQQMEGAFTQPNAAICQSMLNWAVDSTRGFHGDLLELYCGNGNFTLPLAHNFEHVLATEISKPSIKSALHNCTLNQIHNVQFVRMSSEELTQAFNGERDFRRLQGISLEDLQFSTVFVDPPRAGLDDKTLQLVSRFDNIIYISCNPITLADNMRLLCHTHDVARMALFDQFPYTHHRECGAVLVRRS